MSGRLVSKSGTCGRAAKGRYQVRLGKASWVRPSSFKSVSSCMARRLRETNYAGHEPQLLPGTCAKSAMIRARL
jgi:hypothetical protein